MKPLHLNLAARPYRDYRPVYAVVVVVSLITAFLMLYNVDTYYRYVHATQNTRTRTAQLVSDAARERQQAAAIDGRIKAMDLRLLDDQTRFINARLYERAFSWSALLEELETVVADDVRVIAIAPNFDEATGSINLRLDFDSKTPEGLTETLTRMHSDPQFSNPFPGSQTRTGEGSYAFDLTVIYRPPNARTEQLVTQ